MRAILIDAAQGTVQEIDTVGDLDALYGLIHCQMIEVAHEFPNGDVLYVDEEGLLKQPQRFFDIGAHQPFAGNGVIIGCDGNGETVAAATPIDEIVGKVSFQHISDLIRQWETSRAS